MFEQPHELRLLANWYRDWSELGDQLDRIWCRKIIHFLEKRATEIEELAEARPAATHDYCFPQGLVALKYN